MKLLSPGFKSGNAVYTDQTLTKTQKAAEGRLDTLPSARIGDKSIASIARSSRDGSIARVLFGGRPNQDDGNTDEHTGGHHVN